MISGFPKRFSECCVFMVECCVCLLNNRFVALSVYMMRDKGNTLSLTIKKLPMHALVLEEYMKLAYREVPDPVPGPGEVLVRVKAVGICGSDIHGMDGSSGRRIPPIIMGHEAAGTIEQTGQGVMEWKTGDRVTFDSTVYDPEDWYSRRGYYNLSDKGHLKGLQHHLVYHLWV